jgi:2-oxoglutarate/2-oxoacid ferredoxin oxidoreductase subunit alpha
MTTIAPELPRAFDRAPLVNDFSLVVATANGTGSQTANLTLLRSFFRMGIPVHGKNVFPSNIQGLPTWYHIRVSAAGYVARSESALLVAFNAATVDADLRDLPPGGVAILRDDLPPSVARDDITVYPLPVKALLEVSQAKGKVREYLANMTYVGVVGWLLGVPLDVVEAALEVQFGGRRKLVEPTCRWCAPPSTGPRSTSTNATPSASNR